MPNRHRRDWSAMHDSRKYESQDSLEYKEMIEKMEYYINRFGFQEVVTMLRNIKTKGERK